MPSSAAIAISRLFLLIVQVLATPGPYPMVVLPSNDSYWVDGTDDTLLASADADDADDADDDARPIVHGGCGCCGEEGAQFRLEADEMATCYRKHFVGRVRLVFTQRPHQLASLQ